MKEKRVLVINSFNSDEYKGGAEIITELLCKKLNKNFKNVYLLTTTNNKNKVIFKKHKEFINIIFRPWFPGAYSLSRNKISKIIWHIFQLISPLPSLQLIKLILKLKPDLSIISNIYGFTIPLIFIIKLFSKKNIIWIHDFNWVCVHPGTLNSRKKKLCKNSIQCKILRAPQRFIFKNSKKLFISNFSLYSYQEHENQELKNKNILYNPCCNYSEIIKTNIKREVNNKIRIGYIGSISKLKGVEYIIESFLIANKMLCKKNIDSSLEIAGNGNQEYINKLKKKFRNYKKINFVGYKKSYEFYKDIDIVVINSILRDTFPGVGLESLLAHRYLLVSDLVGTKDLLEYFPDQLNIFNNKKSLTNLLYKTSIKINSTYKFKEYNYEKANEVFNPDKWYEKFIQTLSNFK